jgi:hypothetical protein
MNAAVPERIPESSEGDGGGLCSVMGYSVKKQATAYRKVWRQAYLSGTMIL